MLKLLTCSLGHFWESDDDASACPECGAAADPLPHLDLTPAPLPAPAPPMEPTTLAMGLPTIEGYDLLEEVGPGPCGFRLYRASQRLIHREVVIEVVMAREDPAQRSWSSLRSEAGLLGKLSHPHIRTILEAGERDRQLFYNVVERIDGPTLARHAAEAALTVPQAVRLVELLAHAVEHAHNKGVLHRHLEPAKVLLQPAAEQAGVACRLGQASFLPRIVGFGLPRRPVEGDATDAELFSDQGFLSPEQAWGRTKDLGPATDVYGLGGVLYWLLSGRAPFRGPTLGDTLDAVQTAALIPPSQYRRVPADLEYVCKKALARVPRQRHATAAALAEDLRRVARGRAPVGGPTGVVDQLRRWGRRGGMTYTAVAVVAALATAAVAYWAGASGGAPPSTTLLQAQAERDQARREAAALRAALDNVEQQKRLRSYHQKVTRVVQALNAGQADQARALLDTCSHEERHFEWHYLKARADGGGELRLSPGPSPPTALAFSAASPTALATATQMPARPRPKGRIDLWELPHLGRKRSIDVDAGPVVGLKFVDGATLAGVAGDLLLWDVRPWPTFGRATSRPLRRPGDSKPFAALAWNPVRHDLAVATRNGEVMVFAPGQPDWLLWDRVNVGGAAAWVRLAYRPDGQALAVGRAGDSQLTQYHSTRLVPHLSFPGPGTVLAFAYAPNGDLAVARSDRSIRLHDSRTGEEVGSLQNLPSSIHQLAFSPDGRRLAVACEGGLVQLFGRAGGSWEELLDLPGDGVHGLSFNASGRALAAAGDRGTVVFGGFAK
ncbi:MAG: serine/threonine-protein kinase [Gemmataceae bacterium]